MKSFLHISFFAVVLSLVTACAAKSPARPLGTEITFPNVGLMGIFDPAVDYDPQTQRLWMSYSYVEPSVFIKSNKHFGVGIRLAYSKDGGKSWQDAGVVVSPFRDHRVGPLPSVNPKLNLPAGSAGTWQSETSSLIYDAAAPKDQRWKIVWHQYLKANGTSYFVDYAWIAMKMAATPQGLATAKPIKLFGGKFISRSGEARGAPAFSPIAGPARIALNRDVTRAVDGADAAELARCVWAEPSLLADEGGVHLALNCQDLRPGGPEAYIVMFTCARPCDMTRAASWTYQGRVLSPADARAIGQHNFSAADLVRRGHDYYLMVTPVKHANGAGYDGCRLYRFADFARARLARKAGRLVEVLRYDGIPDVHNGACAAHERMTAGILLSQFRADRKPVFFHVYQTGVGW